MALSQKSENSSLGFSVEELLEGVFDLEESEARRTIASLTYVVKKRFPHREKAFRLAKVGALKRKEEKKMIKVQIKKGGKIFETPVTHWGSGEPLDGFSVMLEDGTEINGEEWVQQELAAPALSPLFMASFMESSCSGISFSRYHKPSFSINWVANVTNNGDIVINNEGKKKGVTGDTLKEAIRLYSKANGLHVEVKFLRLLGILPREGEEWKVRNFSFHTKKPEGCQAISIVTYSHTEDWHPGLDLEVIVGEFHLSSGEVDDAGGQHYASSYFLYSNFEAILPSEKLVGILREAIKTSSGNWTWNPEHLAVAGVTGNEF